MNLRRVLARFRFFFVGRLNPAYAAMSLEQLRSLEREQWDTFLPLFLQGLENDAECQRAGRALVDIRKERTVRSRWKALSVLVGLPLPRGKNWAFIHDNERPG